VKAFDEGAARRILQPIEAAPGDEGRLLDRAARVVWSHLTEPGDGVAGKLIAGLGAAPALRALVENAPLLNVLSVREERDGRGRWMPRLALDPVSHAMRLAARAGVSLVVPSDPEWPERMNDLGVHAPVCLWVRGRAEAMAADLPQLALVGARAATGYGENIAMEMASEMAGLGVAVVSGGAYGIDGAAHRAALTAGGTTTALLAGGVDRPYPAGHTDMLERVAATGALVSEVPPGAAPTKWRFLQRNRLIAAAAHATIVVEAGWRSGSLNTAGHAVTLARPLGAVPGPVTSAASAGCHRLLREFGAECITTPDEARELMGAMGESIARTGRDDRTDEYTRMLDALSGRLWRETDEVVRRAGMMREEVEALLGVLTLEGRVERGLDGWRRRTPV
jgi:DNA processing protein